MVSSMVWRGVVEGGLDKTCTVVVWGRSFQRKQADAYAGGQHVSLVLGARGSSVDDDETGGGASGLERHVVSYFTTLVNASRPSILS